VARFKPAGEVARWRVVYERFSREQANVGDTVTHVELGELLDLGPEHKHRLSTISGAVREAIRHLEEDQRRTLEPVPGVGYRVADIEGHVKRVIGQRLKHRRALVRSGRSVAAIDRNEIDSPELLQRVEAQQAVIDALMEADRRLTEKVARHDKMLGILSRESEARKVDVETLRGRLSRLEGLVESH
jgi:hypothetical protein